ncbi:MAG: transglutaminase-like domain-containing protein [Bacillota bacterium]
MNEETLLKETPLLDFTHPSIEALIKSSSWRSLSPYKKIEAVYYFVRDSIGFGYSKRDTLKASTVLIEGIGQCNTKGILLMALLRALEIPAKIEGFEVDASFQKELFPPMIRNLSPSHLLHSRVLVFYEGTWIPLEGYILDKDYIDGLKRKFDDHKGSFYGYAVATKDFGNLHIDWQGEETYIQKDAITKALGTFETPDALFGEHDQSLSKLKALMYRYSIRHLMNKRVRTIRNSR